MSPLTSDLEQTLRSLPTKRALAYEKLLRGILELMRQEAESIPEERGHAPRFMPRAEGPAFPAASAMGRAFCPRNLWDRFSWGDAPGWHRPGRWPCAPLPFAGLANPALSLADADEMREPDVRTAEFAPAQSIGQNAVNSVMADYERNS